MPLKLVCKKETRCTSTNANDSHMPLGVERTSQSSLCIAGGTASSWDNIV